MNDTPQSPPIKGLGKLIHIAGWGILFCSPFFFTGRESQVTFEGYFRSIIVPLSFMLVFYLNYGWLVRRYLFNRRTGRFLLINLLLIGGMMLSCISACAISIRRRCIIRLVRPAR